MEKNLIRTHKDLEGYQVAFKWAMQIFQQAKLSQRRAKQRD
jgi:hypothetical protein